ncbi:MAG: hypothetical protein KJ666_14565 [Bacteroidetes bacterium]|nr:hypothetical protein [Bacteroidota bacterium]MBU2585337.1 hypothetical protein [Bacteroidota bacterium]
MWRLLLILFIAVTLNVANSLAQEIENVEQKSEIVICSNCKMENQITNKFCTQCGIKIVRKEKLAEQVDKPFSFDHLTGRLFSIPQAEVLRSLDLSLLVGGSFGISNTDGFIGTLSLGLGGFGDIEMSTISLLGSVFSKSENFASLGLKVAALKENETLPGLSFGLRTNNQWNTSRNENIQTAASDLGMYGLSSTEYEARMTTFYTAFSKRINQVAKVHLGIGVTDLRYKNVRSYFISPPYSYSEQSEQKKNMILAFGGIDFNLNERTSLMFEAQTIPYFKVDPKKGSVEPSKRIAGVAGLRFVVSKWLILDSGVRYQDNYKGLADAEIKIALNGFINLGFK